jgi:hypothetical protein
VYGDLHACAYWWVSVKKLRRLREENKDLDTLLSYTVTDTPCIVNMSVESGMSQQCAT